MSKQMRLRGFAVIAIVTLISACAVPAATQPAPTVAPPTATAAPSATLTPTTVPPTATLAPTATLPPTEPPPTPTHIPVDLTPAQLAAIRTLASDKNIPVEQIQVVSTEAAEWPDGCLGVVLPGVLCTQGKVPGFRIILSAGGRQYEYHTNQNGRSVTAADRALHGIRIAVRAPDNSVLVTDTQVALDQAALPAMNGFLPLAGVARGTVYALAFGDQGSAVAMDLTGTHALPFVQKPNYGLAVWPGDAASGPRLAWGTQTAYSDTRTSLVTSAPDGSQLETLLTENGGGSAGPYQLLAERWSADGKSLYFSREPFGIGGYILFPGASSLYKLDVATKQITEVIPFKLGAGAQVICLDALSGDDRLVADHCTDKVITIRDLSTGQSTVIQPPTEISGFGPLGSARFSPDGTRVAFALAKGDPSGEQGWVAVSDALSGGSKLVLTGQTGQSFIVIGWLNANTLLLQTDTLQCNPDCPSSVWTVGIDGGGLTKVADGIFLTLADQY